MSVFNAPSANLSHMYIASNHVALMQYILPSRVTRCFFVKLKLNI